MVEALLKVFLKCYNKTKKLKRIPIITGFKYKPYCNWMLGIKNNKFNIYLVFLI